MYWQIGNQTFTFLQIYVSEQIGYRDLETDPKFLFYSGENSATLFPKVCKFLKTWQILGDDFTEFLSNG